ncbi:MULTISPECIES: TerC family protein [Nitrospirillum]|uniref:YjbE family integral membrane protein n=1 Tax=Nitrospirillum amazonense TaxID=28077 RepID=A0A560FQM4_9PROT|nr:TerC family protein [Nitrospirillum amazonense]MEC4595251.1 TerC family protein [Nitrospirillum amazonense]TWB23913.1 YjbE family integral membrane protein [Nitrospirillum amazonense]
MLLAELTALIQVLLIDLVLAGDNALVVGMAASGVPVEKRRKVIFWGIGVAVLMRIGFALLATRLLDIIGLTLAGGILLLWVCWKLWRELRQHGKEQAEGHEAHMPSLAGKSVGTAIRQIALADVSMSLDNVLAVAGAAEDHTWVMVLGLVLSVALMGAAATLIARLLSRYFWISYIGLAIIAYVACHMIWDGGTEVAPFAQPLIDLIRRI